MKKNLFPIQMIPASKEGIKIVHGYIDGAYGFYKEKLYWIATDLLSGCSICKAKTRKACVEWIEQNSDLLSRAKQERSYHEKVLNFYKLLKKESYYA